MNCVKCGKELKPNWKVCPYCGHDPGQKPLCPACGEEIEDGWARCPFCKADLKTPALNEDKGEELLKRADILCTRGNYDGALKLYEEYITVHYDRMAGYIGVLRAHSNNYSVYEGERLQKDITAIVRLNGGAPIEDRDYTAYIAAREKYLADLAQKKRAEEEAKRKAVEEAAQKRKAKEEAKRKAEEAAGEEAARKAEEAKIFSRDGENVTFGIWPQSIKEESVKLLGGTDESGYLTGKDGNKYAKVKDNYYKVEPIKWRILAEKDGCALIFCKDIIANMRYNGRSSNYTISYIRKWLNGEFLNKAFNSIAQSKILTAEVDNSLRSTLDDKNAYVCENTQDKVFLLSREEVYKKYNLGDGGRLRSPTDYAKAKGMLTYKNSGNSWWWTRSPSCFTGNIYGVNPEGACGLMLRDYDAVGIVPAMWIKL